MASDEILEDYSNGTYEYEEDIPEPGKTLISRLIMPVIYGIFSFTAVVGYSMVVYILANIIVSRAFLHVYVYVAALSLTDVLYLCTTPLTIIHMLENTWSFGENVCKFMFFCEGMHKCFSICLLVGLTADRHLAICHPLSSRPKRTIRAALKFVFISFITTALINSPFISFAKLSEISLDSESSVICGLQFPSLFQMLTKLELFTNSSENDTAHFFETPNDGGILTIWMSFGTYYMLFMFLCYHLLPGALIVYFSIRMCIGIDHQYRSTQRRSSKRSRVLKLIFAVVVVYFLCWSPFWFLQLFIRFAGMAVNDKIMAVIAKIIYTLPLLHVNLNSVFYTFLNKCLRQSYRRSFRPTSTSSNQPALRALQLESQLNRARKEAKGRSDSPSCLIDSA